MLGALVRENKDILTKEVNKGKKAGKFFKALHIDCLLTGVWCWLSINQTAIQSSVTLFLNVRMLAVLNFVYCEFVSRPVVLTSGH